MNEFYGIDKNDSTKDKSVIVKKLHKLEDLMCEFLGIPRIKIDENNASDILEFIHQHVAPSATQEDIEQYAEVLQTLARKIGQSELWKDGNIPSLITIVAWSFEHDIDLDVWLVDYCSRNESYLENQLRNFENMRDDLEQYIKSANVA